ncbi:MULTISPECIES: hypothetical protein [Auritidibacter]|uniref:Uncharacterized protein n=3 Tax=Micrococcaceae TaxID=1268 RepID=A0AAJ6AEY9_9MICC|nr:MULTISPECIES: hypothetical protein [Auritidibacter]NIH71914.1 hypothetical protein [Auritidibacter ignavus]WGH86084.1 hypothetical protein QDX24_11085 [Auritidibacter ignavus]WGH88368.1 hypothetical protein QDX22_11085 [Auritidibacter ignavus]WGH92045.1 hypothetical protein QDX21_06765 [Auritidibacter ignavus]WHS27235.1 hypothetical protein QM395_07475 [Auritidibacter ignavus]
MKSRPRKNDQKAGRKNPPLAKPQPQNQRGKKEAMATKQKKFGINKLGTLSSYQTTVHFRTLANFYRFRPKQLY